MMVANYVELLENAVRGIRKTHTRTVVFSNVRATVRAQLEAFGPEIPEIIKELELEKLESAIAEVSKNELVKNLTGRNEEPPETVDIGLAVDAILNAVVDNVVYEATINLAEEPDGVIDFPLPEPKTGPEFEVGPNNKLRLASTGIPTVNDRRQLEHFHTLLSELAEDLVNACTGSNAYSFVSTLAARYRRALGDTVENTSIDQMYVYGIRLETALADINSRIASGDYPEASPAIAEPLTSLVASHGPAVILTERGRELHLASLEYNSDVETPEMRSVQIEFAEAVRENGELVEGEDSQLLSELNQSVNSAPDARRVNQVARAANVNLLATLAKVVIFGATNVAAVALVNSDLGAAAVGNTTNLINAGTRFFVDNAALLRHMAALGGNDLSWLTAFVRFIGRRA